MAKISKEEYETLKDLGEQWEWMARDSGGNRVGNLFAYSEKPFKNHYSEGWVYGGWFRSTDNHLFQFIKWEDDEPHNIAELIEEYEDESEEREQKFYVLNSEGEAIPYDDLVQSIQWEDSEPYNISELIEEYEYLTEHVSHAVNERVKELGKAWSESEEAEVDKQKLIEKWESAIESAEFYGKGKEDRLIDYMKDFLSDLYQLDELEVTLDRAFEKVAESYPMTKEGISRHLQRLEAYGGKVTYGELDDPEVLSSDWIKDNQLMWTSIHGSEYYVPANKLYGKLVPKQEEVDRAYKDGYEKGKQHTFYKGYLKGLADKESINPERSPEVDKHKELLDELNDLYARKNQDYGNSFDESLDEDGLLVLKIRLGDKYKRFSTLINQKNEVVDESMRDTLIDLANYALMGVMWMDSQEED